MAESNVARIRPADEKSFRLAPQNVEAEQALLGAILVNNEAFYRVSDFLLPEHFYEPVHREIYEIAGKIIRAGKAATPITVKTYLPDQLTSDMTMQQYLARLAAEATTVINAADYGQTIYDLAIRRALIQIGEEMTTVAYDADVEMTAPKQIEEAEKSAVRSRREGPLRWRLPGVQRSAHRSHQAWPAKPISATARCRAWPPASPISTA